MAAGDFTAMKAWKISSDAKSVTRTESCRRDYSPEDDMIFLEGDGIKITLEEFLEILSTYNE